MIKLTLPVFKELGFAAESIFTTLEMKMKCGLGQCGRCNIGPSTCARTGRFSRWRSCNSSLRNSSKSDPDSTAESASQPCGRNQRITSATATTTSTVTTFRRHRVFVENLRGLRRFRDEEHDCAFSDSVASLSPLRSQRRVAD